MLVPSPTPHERPAPLPGAATMRHYPRDHSVFIDDEYVVKGVAGAILWKLARDHVARRRIEFTNRELRLAGDELGLPPVRDNLETRLLLLIRRLDERGGPLRLRRAGRGKVRLEVARPLVLQPQHQEASPCA